MYLVKKTPPFYKKYISLKRSGDYTDFGSLEPPEPPEF
jgi:hypothetical protein